MEALAARTLADLPDAEGHAVDQVVVTYFAAPRSYTAEDVVEISCHGSPVVLRYALERACEAGARLAEPGEFTLRAYLNGRIDLPQAEAIRDLIDATTLYQARIAAQQAEGSVSRRLKPVKEQLLELIALLEAGIDFAEDDISVAPAEEILRRLEPILRRRRAASPRASLRQAGARGFHAGDRRAAERRQEQSVQPPAGAGPRHRDRDPGNHARRGLGDGRVGGIPVKLLRHGGHPRSRGTRRNAGHRAQLSGDGGRRPDAGGGGPRRAARPPRTQSLIGRAGRRAAPWSPATSPICRAAQAELAATAGRFRAHRRGHRRTARRDRRSRRAARRLEQEGGFITSLRHEQLLRESGAWLEKARAAARCHDPA